MSKELSQEGDDPSDRGRTDDPGGDVPEGLDDEPAPADSSSSTAEERAFALVYDWSENGALEDGALENGGQDAVARLCADQPSEVARHIRILIDGMLGAASPASLDGRADEPQDESVARIVEELKERDDLATRYDVRGVVARGGMSVVFRAFDRDLQREVALKVVQYAGEELMKQPPVFPAEHPDGQALNPNTWRRRRHLKEAEVTASLDHPAIVPLHGLGVDHAGRQYFAMKLIQGGTFQDLIDRVHVPGGEPMLNRAVELLLNVTEALAYAHESGIIHRDIKPRNIMIEDRFRSAYMMDWGLALRADDPNDACQAGPCETLDLSELLHRVTHEASLGGNVVGSLSYMSPEQARGVRADERSDVYSLGAVMYHLLTGHPPYADEAGSIATALNERAPTALLECAPHLRDNGLVGICERAMARQPAERYPTAAGFGAALREHLDYWSQANVEIRRQLRRNRELVGFHDGVLLEGSPDRARGVELTLVEAVDRYAARLDLSRLHGEDAALLGKRLGSLYREFGRLMDSRSHLEAAQRLTVEAHGEGSPESLACAWELALTYDTMRMPRAGALFQKTYESLKAIDPLDPETLRVAFFFAEHLRRQPEDLARARELYEEIRILAPRAERVGDIGLIASEALVGLGLIHLRLGDMDAAITDIRQCIDEVVAKEGETHPLAINVRLDLGQALGRAGRDDEALAETEKAVALQKQVFGTSHPHTLLGTNNLAKALMNLSRFDEGVKLLEQTLALMRELPGDDRQDTTLMSVLMNLGAGLTALGRAPEGLPCLREAVLRAHASFGMTHYLTQAARLESASCLLALSRFEEAAAHASAILLPDPVRGTKASRFAAQAQELLEEALGAAGEWTKLGRRLTGLGGRALGFGDPEGATRLLTRGEEILSEHVGDEDTWTRAARQTLREAQNARASSDTEGDP